MGRKILYIIVEKFSTVYCKFRGWTGWECFLILIGDTEHSYDKENCAGEEGIAKTHKQDAKGSFTIRGGRYHLFQYRVCN